MQRPHGGIGHLQQLVARQGLQTCTCIIQTACSKLPAVASMLIPHALMHVSRMAMREPVRDDAQYYARLNFLVSSWSTVVLAQ